MMELVNNYRLMSVPVLIVNGGDPIVGFDRAEYSKAPNTKNKSAISETIGQPVNQPTGQLARRPRVIDLKGSRVIEKFQRLRRLARTAGLDERWGQTDETDVGATGNSGI